MAVDVLITFLPDEVIEFILEDENIEIVDIMRFALTCKQLYRTITTSNKLWRRKFFQRWPFLKEVYESNENAEIKTQNWMREVQASVCSRENLLYQLSLMSAKNYEKQELSHSELRDFDLLFYPKYGAHPLAYHFLVDELITLIKRPVENSNLTHKYYAYKVVRYLRQNYLAGEWQKFIGLPQREQILEKGAAIVAQWSQPERRVSYSYISTLLDDIADRTKNLLREQNPVHPIFSVPAEQFDTWKRMNIDDNQWCSSETKQIMTALCETMFAKLGFHGNSEMYYSSENSFIDRVLERRHGIPITLAIVFESVARRLGVRCEPVSFPSHFLLRWKEKYTTPESEDIESYYIDVFNGGQFLTKNNCPRIGGISKCPIERYNVHSAATAVEVVERMANNLEVAGRQRTHLNGRAARLRSALEFLFLVRPHDTSTILSLARFYMLHQMDLAELVTVLNQTRKNSELTSRIHANHILQMLQDYQKRMKIMSLSPKGIGIKSKIRTQEVKYAIGLIMKHRTYGYLCIITGWDLRCSASIEWMNEMGVVEELADGANQPFYHVFADDGSSRYAAQENLLMATCPEWVDHYEVGKYFSSFNGSYYIPNEEKAMEYPEDAEVCSHLMATSQYNQNT